MNIVRFILLMIVISTGIVKANDSEPPYLYYYSDTLNAFVIERADGADSRIFGDGIMPENTNTVDGPGWSPSGQWFA